MTGEGTQQPGAAPGAPQQGLEGQQGQQGQQAQGQQGAQGQQRAEGQPGQRGQVSGRVTAVNLPDSQVTLRTQQDETVELRAKPGQLANVRVGQQLSAQWAEYGNERWMMDNLDQTAEIGREERISGQVTEVDRDQGSITLSSPQRDEDLTLRAHPAELQQIAEGQNVTATFQNVGENKWLKQVQPGQQRAGTPRPEGQTQ